MDEIIASTKPVVNGMAIMPPAFWETNKKDQMAATIMEHGGICRELARKHGVLFADAQAYADRMLARCHSSHVAWGRVHPNIPGHHVIAHALLDALEFDFNRK